LPAEEIVFKLRNDQVRALSEAANTRFENRMMVHVQKFFPRERSALGEDGTRNLIREGMRQAPQYGFHNEREVCQYIDLMVVWGQDFATNERLPWARALLTDPTLTDPAWKMSRLYKTALEKLNERGNDGAVR
jgi:hypothetical protein